MQTHSHGGGVREERWEKREVSPKSHHPTWWCCGGNSARLAAAVADWGARGTGFSCQNAKIQPKVTVLSENLKLFCLLLQ